jgi:acetyl/propionyl-CoA carboxylase alpha subunit
MSFSTVLVANRGEIARRIFRTCRRLGYGTVAVYSDADRTAPFVREADRAFYIGEPPASSSYLSGERILAAAVEMGADAIHPGYGFLSENPDFAQSVVDAGLVFIGPTAASMQVMGDKAQARQFMSQAGVLVTPGYDGIAQSNEILKAEAIKVGLPVMVKAAAGGGGKGMSIVHDASSLTQAIEQARRLAQNAFGSDRLIIEKYIESPRHLEVQILGDQHGNVVHVYERECSVQRRFQKVIEEAPAPNLSRQTQEKLHHAAIAAAKQVNYVGAGTVEFIADQSENFYFLEMNTRLQVEHPVSECVTGLDLVEWQLRIASGEPVLDQSEVKVAGHAIEARIYAEDPSNDYLPCVGEVSAYYEQEAPGVRYDSGIEQGSEVGIYYDPMLSKVIASGRDRAQARRRLLSALEQYVVGGLTTNRKFLVDVLSHDALIDGQVDTGLLSRDFSDWTPSFLDQQARLSLAALIAMQSHSQAQRKHSLDLKPGWRLIQNQPIVDEWLGEDKKTYRSHYRWVDRDEVHVTVDGEVMILRCLEMSANKIRVEIESESDNRFQGLFRMIRSDTGYCVLSSQSQFMWTEIPRFPEVELEEVAGGCLAPMPGKIVRLLVAEGDRVDVGTSLVVLEAMKMEQTLEASGAGTVATVHVLEGDLVSAQDTLVEIAYDEA